MNINIKKVSPCAVPQVEYKTFSFFKLVDLSLYLNLILYK